MRSCLLSWDCPRLKALLPFLHVLGWHRSRVAPLRLIVRGLLGCSLIGRPRRRNWNGSWPRLPAKHSMSDVKSPRSSPYSTSPQQLGNVICTGLFVAAECCMCYVLRPASLVRLPAAGVV